MEKRTIIGQSIGLSILVILIYFFFIREVKIQKENWAGVEKQPSSYSCGYSCLKMIFDFYKIKFNEKDMWNRLFGNEENGTNLLKLKEYSISRGLNAQGIKYENCNFDESKLPLLAHISSNHFVVIHKIEKDKIYVKDPLFGNLNYTKEEFCDKWQGIALEFSLIK